MGKKNKNKQKRTASADVPPAPSSPAPAPPSPITPKSAAADIAETMDAAQVQTPEEPVVDNVVDIAIPTPAGANVVSDDVSESGGDQVTVGGPVRVLGDGKEQSTDPVATDESGVVVADVAPEPVPAATPTPTPTPTADRVSPAAKDIDDTADNDASSTIQQSSDDAVTIETGESTGMQSSDATPDVGAGAGATTAASQAPGETPPSTPGWDERGCNVVEAIPVRSSDREHHLSVLVGTWNVNNSSPGESILKWLEADTASDVIVLGFQEMDLTAFALMTYETKKADDWEEWIDLTLEAMVPASNTGDRYVKVASKQLVGLLIFVYAKQCHAVELQNVAVATATTGVMGIVANKGGVAARFDLYGTTFCFVNSHLAAHDNELDRRNQDYHDIIRKATFEVKPYNILDHERVIWLGDLNYRIMLSSKAARSSIQACQDTGDFMPLRPHCQLLQQRRLRHAFDIFCEGPLTFAPTYKYNPNSDVYDTSAKFRTPSWTDRVMWRKGDATSLIEYGRVELWTSDHKPVRACFDIMVRNDVRRDRAVAGPSKGKGSEEAGLGARLGSMGNSFMKNIAWAMGVSQSDMAGVASPTPDEHGSGGGGNGGVAPNGFEYDLFEISSLNAEVVGQKAITTLLNMAPIHGASTLASDDSTNEWTFERVVDAVTYDRFELPEFMSRTRQCVRGTVHVSAPAPAVSYLVWDTLNRQRWDDTVMDAQQLEEFGPDHRIVQYSSPPVGKLLGQRQFCVLQSRATRQDGVRTVAFKSVIHRMCLDRRMQIHGHLESGGFVIQPSGDRGSSTVTFVLDADPGGLVPPPLAKTFIDAQFAVLTSLKQRLQQPSGGPAFAAPTR